MIVIAASNHVDKLDKALLRPGRFDRQVLVAPPDRDGREAILRAHAKGKPLGADLDLRDVARKTTGMTGAQLANALNEAAIIAGRAGRKAMAREDLDEALLRQSVGSQQARRLNAEGAPDRRLPRGRPRALPAPARPRPAGDPQHRPARAGARLRRPLAARRTPTSSRARSCSTRSSRCSAAAPPRRRSSATSYSGAADDLARVHAVCKQMVAEFGMGVALDAEGAPPIALPTGDYAMSDRTRRDVDVAAMTLARDAHRRARALLAANRRCLDDLAANALERETLTREDLDEIFAAHELDGRRQAGALERAAAALASVSAEPK